VLKIVRTGGHGIAWDGPFNKELRRLVQETYATNKIIAAVDHGPAAIVHAKNIKLGDPNEGMPLIFHKDVRTLPNADIVLSALCFAKHTSPEGYFDLLLSSMNGRIKEEGHQQAVCLCMQVTCFSNTEEEAVKRATLVPFLLEDRIREVYYAPTHASRSSIPSMHGSPALIQPADSNPYSASKACQRPPTEAEHTEKLH